MLYRDIICEYVFYQVCVTRGQTADGNTVTVLKDR